MRRGSFFGRIPVEEASRQVKETVTALPDDRQDRITGLVVGIRDFFDRSSIISKKKRRI